MIDYISGEIAELTPAAVTIDNRGIGYLINISLNSYSALTGKKSCKMFIHEAIREDAYQLFGFVDKHERNLFLQLISVSGIGAGTARMILSSMAPHELESVIASGNADLLKTVKGIGMKTAQRIIVDLKDKVGALGGGLSTVSDANKKLSEESVAALVMLGFAQMPAQKAVAKILKDNSDITIEQVLKIALKML